jgi:hypothetical protein
MNVFSIGSSQANFLKELYGQISSNTNGKFEFTLSGEMKFSDDIKYSGDDLVKSRLIDKEIPKNQISTWKLFFILITNTRSLASSIPLKEEIAFLFFKKKLSAKGIFYELKKILLDRYIGNRYIRPLFKDYQVIHVHFLMLNNIKYAWYIPSTIKVICTFWGSDVLRTSGVENQFYLAKLLKRADTITSQSLEMREFILAKYGRIFKDKFKKAMFALPDNVFKNIDQILDKNEARIKFCKKSGIPIDKKTLVIGHNGSKFNNHIEIFESLLDSKEFDISNYTILFPFTYMPDGPKLKNELALLIENYPNCFILENYMSWQELAEFRISTDYYIHAPQSDAMSGALTEMIYAGAVPIVGSWLPYQNYDRLGIELLRIDEFDEIPDLILRHNSRKNDFKEIINNHLRGLAITNNWIGIYNSLS